MTAKPDCARRGRGSGGKLQQRRLSIPVCCSVRCLQANNLRRISAGDSGHDSARPAQHQRSIALLVADRLFQRQNNHLPAQTSDQERRPVLVVSNLNGDNTAGPEHFKLRLEVAGAFVYVAKFSEDLAVAVENGWPIFCAAQRLLPAIEQWVDRFHTLRTWLRKIKFHAPLSR